MNTTNYPDTTSFKHPSELVNTPLHYNYHLSAVIFYSVNKDSLILFSDLSQVILGNFS